jgi:hypothetical protein
VIVTRLPAAAERRLRPLLTVLLLAPLLAGCGVKFLYGNVDRIVVWQTEDYVDLDRAQRDWLRQRVRVHRHWHRIEQLPEWAALLRRFDLEIRDGIDGARLDVYYRTAEAWGEAIVEEMLPTASGLLLDLDADQVAELPGRLAEANAELNEDYAGRPPDEQRAVWREEMRDGMSDWIGDLTAGQELLVDAASTEVVPDNGDWIGYRERWQAALMDLLTRRDDVDAFRAAFRTLALERERWYTPEYTETRANNERVYREFTLALLDSLSEDQLDRLSRRIDDIATDFEELAADVDEAPRDPGPLVSPG